MFRLVIPTVRKYEMRKIVAVVRDDDLNESESKPIRKESYEHSSHASFIIKKLTSNY